MDCTKTECGFGVKNAFDKTLSYDIASFVKENIYSLIKNVDVAIIWKKKLYSSSLKFLNFTQAPDLHSIKFCDVCFILAEQSDRTLFHIHKFRPATVECECWD